MAITYQIFDAAHRYGLDDMPVTPVQEARQDAVFGAALQTTFSWGQDAPRTGVRESMTVALEHGFTDQVGLLFTAGYVTITDLGATVNATGERIDLASGTLSFSAGTLGTAFEPQNLFAGADQLIGNAYANALRGYGGDDAIDGGGGIDTAYFSGARAQYSVQRNGDSLSVQGPDGSDTLIGVERLHFDDVSVGFDTDGPGGQAYRLYQSVFDRTPDARGLGFWIDALETGVSLRSVAHQFIESAEFKSLYGEHISNETFLLELYHNALHREPDAAGWAFWINVLNQNIDTRAGVLTGCSESAENRTALAGIVDNGFQFNAFHW